MLKDKKRFNRRKFLSLALGAAATSVFTGACSIGAKSLAKNYSDLSNFKNGVFLNPVETNMGLEGSSIEVMWKMMSAKNVKPTTDFVFKGDKIKKELKTNNSLKSMWLGHSTVYIEIDGKRFITDPIFSNHASPVQFVGPGRFYESPLTIEQLPKLDGVIISHDHYDHLDCNSIMQLSKSGVMFYMPLAVGKYFRKWGVPENQINELNWWDSIKIGESHHLIATPSRHFSGRGLFGKNDTLWASWVIKGSKHNVFFGGDGGYWDGYKTIGEKFGPFDLTFIEIGAYGKHWPDIHIGPVKAVQAHDDLGGKILFPIHWGTFNLAIHTWKEPVEKILIEAKEKNIKLALPQPGKLSALSDLPKITKWWKI